MIVQYQEYIIVLFNLYPGQYQVVGLMPPEYNTK